MSYLKKLNGSRGLSPRRQGFQEPRLVQLGEQMAKTAIADRWWALNAICQDVPLEDGPLEALTKLQENHAFDLWREPWLDHQRRIERAEAQRERERMDWLLAEDIIAEDEEWDEWEGGDTLLDFDDEPEMISEPAAAA